MKERDFFRKATKIAGLTAALSTISMETTAQSNQNFPDGLTTTNNQESKKLIRNLEIISKTSFSIGNINIDLYKQEVEKILKE